MPEFVTKLPKNYKIKHKGKDGLQFHHYIPGTANRKWSDYYGLGEHCTQAKHEWWHKNISRSRIMGQRMYEEEHTREQFIQNFGRNYLDLGY